jgi:hypothetical protein
MLITMKAIDTEVIPAAPNLISALLAGFDSITTHVALILFPISLDILLWFGPHLGVKSLVDVLVSQMISISRTSDQETAKLIQENQELWKLAGEHLNMMAALRSYPVGIPSIMVSRLPIQTPAGSSPLTLDIKSILGVCGLWLLLTFLGLILGTLYFLTVSNVATSRQESIGLLLKEWSKAALQVVLLSLLCVALLVGVSIPAGCIISALALGSQTLGRVGLIMYGAAVLWLIFPLLLSPLGIFVNRENFLVSLKNSIRITRMTLPTTSLLILSVIVISQGLDLLWDIPTENTWLALVGVAGHAFVSTGLLAACFIYYRDADRWVKAVLLNWSTNPPKVKLVL